MASQTSRRALRALATAEFVIESARTQKPLVTAELTRLFQESHAGGEGEPPPMPDWDLVQESHASLLEQVAGEVRRTDQVHRVNKVQMSRLRRRRRSLLEELRDSHRDLRKSVEGTYGFESLALVGLDAPPSRALLPVREQLREFLERARQPELAGRLPEPRSGQTPLDLDLIVENMQGRIDTLEDVMAGIRTMRKRLDESLVVKGQALRRHRRTYVQVARILEGYYRLAGLDELASRIRSPAPPRRPEPPRQEGEGETSPPAGEGSAEGPEPGDGAAAQPA